MEKKVLKNGLLIVFLSVARPEPGFFFMLEAYNFTGWDDVCKSRGRIVVNGVLMEVPMPNPEGSQAPRVFCRGTSRGTPFTMIHPRLFHTFSFFRHPGLVKRYFFFPIWSLGTPLENGEGMKLSPLVELNPNMLVWDVEIMTYICPIQSPRGVRTSYYGMTTNGLVSYSIKGCNQNSYF